MIVLVVKKGGSREQQLASPASWPMTSWLLCFWLASDEGQKKSIQHIFEVEMLRTVCIMAPVPTLAPEEKGKGGPLCFKTNGVLNCGPQTANHCSLSHNKASSSLITPCVYETVVKSGIISLLVKQKSQPTTK